MTDRIQTTTRQLAEAALEIHETAVGWQLAQAERAEKQLVAAIDASHAGLRSLAGLQRDAARAWLDLVAPAPAKSPAA